MTPQTGLQSYVPKTYHVTLTRGQKGTYGWEISVHHDDPDQVTAMVHSIDAELREKYQTEESH